jgi:hypothetical protein
MFVVEFFGMDAISGCVQRAKGTRIPVPFHPGRRWWRLGCVVLVGTGEFFEAEDHVLQRLRVRYLAYRRGLQLG